MDAPHRAAAHLPGSQLRPSGPRTGADPIPATARTSAPAPDGAAPGRGLHGRHRECQALDRLVADVRAGKSRVLVLRGEAGAGKTALLDYLAERGAGCRIARAAGAEPEREMAFAGLHQLCAPFLGRLGQLPDPQRDALGSAFHLRDGNPPDRFAAGLATLSLLSEAAADGPLLCLVDDAQWLDTNSAQALAFVARHLTGAPVGVVLALRQPGGEHELTGLPELPVGGLADGDAQALLDSVLIGPVDQRVRNRIAADAHGNPAALLQLPRMLTPGELAGGFALPLRGTATAPDRGKLPAAARTATTCDAAAAAHCRGRADRRPGPGVAGGRSARHRGGSGGIRRRGRAHRVRRAGAVLPSARPGRDLPCRAGHRSASASTTPSRMPPTPAPVLSYAHGTAHTRPPVSMKTWRPAWSTRPTGRGASAAWRRRPRSANAPRS